MIRHTPKILFAVLVALAVLGFFAYASLGVGNARVGACKNFCSLANAEYGSVDGGDCWCVRTDRSYDLNADRIIEWKSRVNAGKIEAVTITQPIPAAAKAAISQQLAQQSAGGPTVGGGSAVTPGTSGTAQK